MQDIVQAMHVICRHYSTLHCHVKRNFRVVRKCSRDISRIRALARTDETFRLASLTQGDRVHYSNRGVSGIEVELGLEIRRFLFRQVQSVSGCLPVFITFRII